MHCDTPACGVQCPARRARRTPSGGTLVAAEVANLLVAFHDSAGRLALRRLSGKAIEELHHRDWKAQK